MDDLTKRAEIYMTGVRMFGPEVAAATHGPESIIAAYMQRDSEQRAEIERLREESSRLLENARYCAGEFRRYQRLYDELRFSQGGQHGM